MLAMFLIGIAVGLASIASAQQNAPHQQPEVGPEVRCESVEVLRDSVDFTVTWTPGYASPRTDIALMDAETNTICQTY